MVRMYEFADVGCEYGQYAWQAVAGHQGMPYAQAAQYPHTFRV
jgi:hypothetical protein